MKIDVLRYNDTGHATLSVVRINGKFECYSLEDGHRDVKEYGETRIPNGTYTVKLRTEGGHHEKYLKKFPEFHEGMLHVTDVPKFEWILIHIGNFPKDTKGCLLTAEQPGIDKESVIGSTNAYKKLYKKVLEAIKKEPVTITYTQIYYEQDN